MSHKRYNYYLLINKARLYTHIGLFIFILLFIPGATETHRSENIFGLQVKGTIEKVNRINLHDTLSRLQSYENRSTWEKQWEAANWVSDEFKKIGLDIGIHKYEYNGRIWPNVIATIKGKERPEEIIMPIAHIDSISNDLEGRAPGADDNASGVAILLETARIIREIPVERTVMFAIFTNEEWGTAGSKAYARQLRNDGANIKAVINLDILAYNRPAWPFYWDAIQNQTTLKHKVKAIIRMARTYFVGLINGRDVVKVAGRELNRELVAITSWVIRETANLKVKELVSNDCG